jgi:copper transport protein
MTVLGAAPASAHAVLEHSSPADGSVLQTAPASVDLVFDEAITLLPDSVRVFGPDGEEVDNGQVEHASGVGASAAVGLHTGLSEGTYLVSYRVISADSHPVSGAYTFSVGHRSTPPAAATSTGSTTVDVVYGLARWLTYAGSALGLGGLAFLAWCWPAGWSSRRARMFTYAGTGSLLVGTLLALAVKGPYDGGLGLSHLADGDLVREVLGTTYGRALDARLLLVAVLVLLLTYRDRLPRQVVGWSVGGLLVATGVTFALCGHAVAGSLRPLAVASDTAHVAAMSIWLGGLALLGAGVMRGDAARDGALVVVRRFSTLAMLAVCVLVATGTYQAVREVRSWDVLFDTHYGHVLLVKLWLVLVALGAAAGSRAWVWQSAHPTKPPLGNLRSSVGVESVVLLAVLVASSLLVTSDPKLAPITSQAVATTVTVGPDRVRISASPDGSRVVRLRLQVLDGQGRAVEPPEVTATFSLPGRQIGPLPVTLTKAGRGLHTGRVGLPVSGRWRLAVTVRTTAIDEATGYVDVPVG